MPGCLSAGRLGTRAHSAALGSDAVLNTASSPSAAQRFSILCGKNDDRSLGWKAFPVHPGVRGFRRQSHLGVPFAEAGSYLVEAGLGYGPHNIILIENMRTRKKIKSGNSQRIGVLYLHHVGVPGGSTRSLLNAVERLQLDGVSPFFVCKRGPNIEEFKKRHWPTIRALGLTQFDNGGNGFYRGLRWLILLREIALIPATCLALIKAKLKWGDAIDLIHANEFTLLPTALIAKLCFNVPLVIHARATQTTKCPLRTKIFERLMSRAAKCLIPIDSAVSSTFDVSCLKRIIHNGEPVPNSNKPLEVASHKLTPFRVGIVANFLRYKGVLDFIDAAAICVSEHGDVDIEFQIVGETFSKGSLSTSLKKRLGFSHDIKEEALSMIKQRGLESRIKLCGFQKDPDKIFGNLDILCFPSHLNAVGRPVFEAAFYGIPSIVALKDLKDHDSIVHDETGIVVPERNPQALANAIIFLAKNRQKVYDLGVAAKALAFNEFDIAKNAKVLLHLYQDVLTKKL
jgi:glycosyltransferase involved in cell wall biosynthesis